VSQDRARPVLERIAFIFYLGLCVCSCGLTGLGLIFAVALGDPQPLLFGCGGTVLSAILRDVGYRQWHFQRWEECCEPAGHHATTSAGAGNAEPAQELEQLLYELTRLDDRAPREGRDVWRVQELRLRASALLSREPGLRARFARELERHPELR
jgi:hypothetical protein